MLNRRLVSYCLTHFAASNLRSPSSSSPALTTFAFAPHSLLSVSHRFASVKPTTQTSSPFSITALSASSSPVINTNMPSSSSKSEPEPRHSVRVRVVSYNLLSSHLAEPDYHTKCLPEHLLASNRLPKILTQLEQEMATSKDPVVFCLQEVSHDWAKALHVFFAKNNYHLVTALYGRPFNGHMGIATAFPLDKYELNEVDLCKLSGTRRDGWPRPPKEDEPGMVRKYIVNPALGLVKTPITAAYTYLVGETRKADDAWDYSKYRQNQFIALKLQQKNEEYERPFWIGNYHMPCAFRTPAVMNLHADLVADRIQQLAISSSSAPSSSSSLPYILAGDFNILPDSPHYALLTTGKLDAEDETYPPPKHGMEWYPKLVGMQSAYAMHNEGSEPEFTNAAHNGALSAESFIGTLDYIFLSKDDWTVKDVKSLPSINDLEGGVYPNENEPSDHLMISASLELE